MKNKHQHVKDPRCTRICLLVGDAANRGAVVSASRARDGTKKAEASGTCGAVTGTEDAIMPGIPGYPLNSHIKETIQE